MTSSQHQKFTLCEETITKIIISETFSPKKPVIYDYRDLKIFLNQAGRHLGVMRSGS